MAFRSVRAAVVALALVTAPEAQAQEVPQKLALMVMLKVLTYDANFATRGSGDFVVLVPFVKGEQARAAEAVEKAGSVDLHSINERALKFIAVPLGELGAAKGSAVLLHAGMADEVAREVVAHATKARQYSLAFDEALVKEGAMLGVASNAGKPQVLLNVATARSIGAEMSPAVLKVARTYQ
jgi:hypothetical protein